METNDESEKKGEQSVRPRGQVIFDNIPLWFILSLLLSLLLYNGWGLVELLLVPTAP